MLASERHLLGLFHAKPTEAPDTSDTPRFLELHLNVNGQQMDVQLHFGQSTFQQHTDVADALNLTEHAAPLLLAVARDWQNQSRRKHNVEMTFAQVTLPERGVVLRYDTLRDDLEVHYQTGGVPLRLQDARYALRPLPGFIEQLQQP